MRTISWLQSGLELTDFSLSFNEGEQQFSAQCVGKYNNEEVYVGLPIDFQRLHKDVWVNQIIDITRRHNVPYRATEMIKLALGPTIGEHALADHNYLNRINF